AVGHRDPQGLELPAEAVHQAHGSAALAAARSSTQPSAVLRPLGEARPAPRALPSRPPARQAAAQEGRGSAMTPPAQSETAELKKMKQAESAAACLAVAQRLSMSRGLR